MSKQSIHTGLPFEMKSVLEYSLPLCIAAVCAPLQQEMRGQAIHLVYIQLGGKQTANLTFTSFSLHYVSCSGFSLPLESVTHFLLQKQNCKKVSNI